MTTEEKLQSLIKTVEHALNHISQCNPMEDSFGPAIRDILEEGLHEVVKDEKGKPGFLLTYDTDKVATCQVLRQQMAEYYNEFPKKYPVPLYTEFLRYWSEPNGKGTPRWYSEKSKPRGRFFIPGRLATWAKGYKPPKETAEPKPQSDIPDRLKMRVV